MGKIKQSRSGPRRQDVADLSQVGSKECPQGESAEAKIFLVFLHARDAHLTNMKIRNISTWSYIFKHPSILLSKLLLRAARYVCV
jgi:hypothetical protein